MIYKMNLLEKERSYGYYENRNSLRTMTAFGVFTGMLSFAIYFILQSLKKSVLADEAAYLVDLSYFSTTFIFLIVSFLATLGYDWLKYDGVSYREVGNNSWYNLVQLGYKVPSMVLVKFLLQYVIQLYMYTVGFGVAVAMASILKFPFVYVYLVTLYLAGALNIFMLLIATMVISLLGLTKRNARNGVALTAFLLFYIQIPMGYYAVISNRDLMRTPLNLFLPIGGSWYGVLMLILAILGFFFIIFRATRTAGLFNLPQLTQSPKLSKAKGDGTTIVIDSQSTYRAVKKQKEQLEKLYVIKHEKDILGTAMSIVMVIAIGFMLLINVVLLAFSYASPEKETAVLGYIPYIFASSTMEPTIKENDIAFFEKVDQYVAINEGDIVLYKDGVKAIQVRQVKSITLNEETGMLVYDCDISNYPQDAIPDVMKDTVEAGWVYGRLAGTNRYLGVIVLFANTVLGRMLFLLMPTLLIFYYKPIMDFFDKNPKTKKKEKRGERVAK